MAGCQWRPIDWVRILAQHGLFHRRAVCNGYPVFSSVVWPWSYARPSYFRASATAALNRCRNNYRVLARMVEKPVLVQAGTKVTKDWRRSCLWSCVPERCTPTLMVTRMNPSDLGSQQHNAAIVWLSYDHTVWPAHVFEGGMRLF